ncbi:PspC domain-containing protein [Candidatus Saccharibacteria bacterium]|nr:PspC domain-containing protein [Candidatus Saccharibacteria bacterium]MCB9821414.1 PspC domain-containing protein [Candidatus Nomurabacteria bacterium]
MKKAQIIELAKQSFYINESAYKKLDTYLASLSKHYQDKEVIKDIELSLADKFKARLKDANSVLDETDVSAVITELGTVEDITGEVETEAKPTGSKKQFYRSKQNAIVGGVASGLAGYFGIDPLYVRIGLVISVLVSFGTTLVLYLVLWMVLPEAETGADERLMLGKTATLKDIEQTLKTKVKEVKQSGANGFLRTTFETTFKVFGIIYKLVLKLVGAGVFLASLAAIAGLTAGMASLVAGDVNVYYAGALVDFPSRFVDYGLLVSVWLLAAVVICLMAYMGMSLLRSKQVLRGGMAAILVGLFVIGLSAAIAFGSNTYDRYQRAVDTSPTMREVALDEFEHVSIANQVDATFIESDEYKVVLTANNFVLDNLDLNIRNGYLYLHNNSNNYLCLLDCNDQLQATVYVPKLETLTLSDQSSALFKSYLTVKNLVISDQSRVDAALADIDQIVIQDQSVLNATVKASGVSLTLTDQSKAILKCADLQWLKLVERDQANVNAGECLAEEIHLDLDNQSHAVLSPTDKLEVINTDKDSTYSFVR